MPDDVQPDQGQGAEGEGGIFAPYLEAVPEEHRETVAGYLKDAEKNVNKRISEASEIEKTLGPYKDLDLSAYPPDQLQELLAWHQQVTATPEAFQTWLADTAKEAGLTVQEAEEVEDAVETGELSQRDVERMIEERVQERLGPSEERLSQWEEQQAINQEETSIRDGFQRLEADEGVSLSDDQKAQIMDLGMAHDGDDWVKFGFDRYREIGTESQKAFLASKTGAPGAPLSAGGAPAFKPTTDFREASNQLRERLRNEQR